MSGLSDWPGSNDCTDGEKGEVTWAEFASQHWHPHRSRHMAHWSIAASLVWRSDWNLPIVFPAAEKTIDQRAYFDYCGNIEERESVAKKQNVEQVARFADMLSAMGAEPRLRIMQLLLSAHPDGLVVGDIGSELEIPSSTLSHHLDKLKNEELVKVRREGTFLWYSANTGALQELLGFLYAECCTRNKAIEPQAIISICR